MTFLDGSEVSYLQTDPISEDIPYAVDRDIFVELYYIFVARAHRRKLNALKISLCDKPVELHMRRRHTELVCCLSRVLFVTCEKESNPRWSGRQQTGFMCCSRAILTSSHVTVCETSIIRLCNYLVLKNFRASNFHRCRPPANYF